MPEGDILRFPAILPVAVILKDIHQSVPSMRNVINGTGKLNSQISSNNGKVSERQNIRQPLYSIIRFAPAARTLKANLLELENQSSLLETELTITPLQLAAQVAECNPRIALFSIYLWNVRLCEATAAILRTIAPQIRRIAGGPELTADYSNASLFDQCIIGEGETALRESCRAWLADPQTTLPGMVIREPEMSLHFEINTDHLHHDTAEMLSKFPVRTLHLECGIQTLNPDVALKIGRSGNTARTLENLRLLTTRTGAVVHADLIFGLPGENESSFAEGFNRLVAECSPAELQINLLKGLPGTELRRSASRRRCLRSQNRKHSEPEVQSGSVFCRPTVFACPYRSRALIWRPLPSASATFI